MIMFMVKKKKYQFSVDLCVEKLDSVPFTNGVFFAKIRLLDERLILTSQREEIRDHCVKWEEKFRFNCKMSANSSNGVLDSKLLRISIRKESKGGRSFQKLGFADIDLAEFAGSGLSKQRFLLEGYDTKHRQDNSTINVFIEMTLLSGDPLFKRPSRSSSSFYATLLPDRGNANEKTSSHTNGAEIYSSLDRNQRTQNKLISSPEESENTDNVEQLVTESLALNLKDKEESDAHEDIENGSHRRNPSACSGVSDSLKYNSAERKQRVQNKLKGCSGDAENRVDLTRVNAEQLISEFLSTKLRESDECDGQEDSGGLQLYVGKDGTATLGSRTAKQSYKPNGTTSGSRQGSRPTSSTHSRQSSAEQDNEGSIRL